MSKILGRVVERDDKNEAIVGRIAAQAAYRFRIAILL
jgi:hypothetical protein